MSVGPATGRALGKTEPRGLERFGGPVLRREEASAERVRGLRVALLASGPGAARWATRLAPDAGWLKVFQRDPSWVLPVVPGIERLARMPALAAWVGRMHLRLHVRDRELRDQLTPRRRHRPEMSSAYYRALARGDWELVAWPIAGVSPRGVRTADGVEHIVDVIVLA